MKSWQITTKTKSSGHGKNQIIRPWQGSDHQVMKKPVHQVTTKTKSSSHDKNQIFRSWEKWNHRGYNKIADMTLQMWKNCQIMQFILKLKKVTVIKNWKKNPKKGHQRSAIIFSKIFSVFFFFSFFTLNQSIKFLIFRSEFHR